MSTEQNVGATRIQFNAQLIAEDMTENGWTKLDLAKRAKVSDMTVIRFLRGERQTAPTAKRIAKALGYPVRRYMVRSSDNVSSAAGAAR